MVAGIGLSFVSESNHMETCSWVLILCLVGPTEKYRTTWNLSLCCVLFLLSNSSPGRMNVMRPEVMAMDPKMRVGMMGLISARAATVVDKVPPTLNKRTFWGQLKIISSHTMPPIWCESNFKGQQEILIVQCCLDKPNHDHISHYNEGVHNHIHLGDQWGGTNSSSPEMQIVRRRNKCRLCGIKVSS